MPALDAARYARQLVLDGFGASGQRRLDGARVLVIGAGGLGSTVIPVLAAAGVGTIGIVDDDTVEVSNLPRQSLHTPADIGRAKVDSATDTIARLNPATRIEAHRARLTADNALATFAAYDLVIDGSDNFPTRYLTDDAAALSRIPCVWGAVHRYDGQAGVSWAAHGPAYRDLFPEPPAPGAVGSCEEAGVLPSVCTVIGGIVAGEAIKLLTGLGEPMLGRVVTYDARSGDVRSLSYERDPDRPPIRSLIDYEGFCGLTTDADAPASGHVSRETANGAGRNPRERTDEEATRAMDDGSDGRNQDRPNILVHELADALARDERIQLVDVREPWEASVASIPGSVLIPLAELPFRAGELDSDARTVVYCHAGPRSDYAREILASLDFADVRSLAGGIDEWSRSVDPSVPRY